MVSLPLHPFIDLGRWNYRRATIKNDDGANGQKRRKEEESWSNGEGKAFVRLY